MVKEQEQSVKKNIAKLRKANLPHCPHIPTFNSCIICSGNLRTTVVRVPSPCCELGLTFTLQQSRVNWLWNQTKVANKSLICLQCHCSPLHLLNLNWQMIWKARIRSRRIQPGSNFRAWHFIWVKPVVDSFPCSTGFSLYSSFHKSQLLNLSLTWNQWKRITSWMSLCWEHYFNSFFVLFRRWGKEEWLCDLLTFWPL